MAFTLVQTTRLANGMRLIFSETKDESNFISNTFINLSSVPISLLEERPLKWVVHAVTFPPVDVRTVRTPRRTCPAGNSNAAGF